MRAGVLRVIASIFLSLSLGAADVDVAFNTSDTGRLGVLNGVDGEVAPQAHCEDVRRLDGLVSTTEMNPLAIPTGGDDIFEVNVFIASNTLTCLRTEDRWLIAAKIGIRMHSVRAMHVHRSAPWRTRYAVQQKPTIAVFVGTI